MKLRDLLRDVELRSKRNDLDLEISAITADSRLVTPGALFVAVPGLQTDGARFIHQAKAKGAAAVVSKDDVEDPRQALAPTAPNFHRRASRALSLDRKSTRLK